MRGTLGVLLLATVLLAAYAPLSPAGVASAGSGTPTFATYAGPSSLPNVNGAGEPSIGVDWKTGAVMMQAYTSTYRVTFNDATVPAGATWTDVDSGNVVNTDPILFTDATTGRTFAGGLGTACSQLSYTDDDGSTWTPMGNACSGTIDHETIGAGPYHGSAPLLASYSHAVYYCAQAGNDACSTSTNGGTTFGAPVVASGACSSLHGHVKVGADGTAYVPNAHCGGVAGGLISTNNGGAWSSYVIPGSGEPTDGFDPSVATTPDNTLYEAWQGADFHQYVAESTNHGSTWTGKVDLGALASPRLVSTTFPDVVAGDNGRVAVAFLGSTTSDAHGGVGTDGAFTGTWYLYVAFTYDGGSTWTLVQTSTDPVQVGNICSGGTTGCPGNTRNLLDFMDASVTKDGRVVVGFADGCRGCSSNVNDAWATIARQSTGKGLFAAYDSTGPNPPAAPTLSASAGNAKVSLAWTTPANGGSAITGYDLYRGTASGAETLYQALGVVNAYNDTAVTNGQTYFYKLAAVNAAGIGTLSNEASATPAAPNAPPTACFTHAESGSNTSVNGTCSSDSDGSVVAWSWSWGDGSAAGSGSTATHAYAAGGNYTVTLTVTDNGGATGATSQTVTVSGPPNQPPTACFASSATGLAASFNGTCSSDPDGSVASWSWAFGDGATGSGATAAHTYAAAGTYNVTLTVTDNKGATGSVTHALTVTADPDPSTPTLQNGVGATNTSGASGSWQYYKIAVPSGKTQLAVTLSATQSCGLLSCNPDLDLYVRQGAKPTTSTYDCAPLTGTSNESCTISGPAANWWYVGINVYSGSSTLKYTVTATYS